MEASTYVEATISEPSIRSPNSVRRRAFGPTGLRADRPLRDTRPPTGAEPTDSVI